MWFYFLDYMTLTYSVQEGQRGSFLSESQRDSHKNELAFQQKVENVKFCIQSVWSYTDMCAISPPLYLRQLRLTEQTVDINRGTQSNHGNICNSTEPWLQASKLPETIAVFLVLKGCRWELCVMPGFVTSGGEDCDLGSEMRLDYLEIFVWQSFIEV